MLQIFFRNNLNIPDNTNYPKNPFLNLFGLLIVKFLKVVAVNF